MASSLFRWSDYNTTMRKRRIVWIILVLFLAFGIGLIYQLNLPRVVDVFPVQGADPVQAGESLRVRFSRPMQTDSTAAKLTIDPPTSGEFTWEETTLIFTPDQPWPSGQNVHAHLGAGAKADSFLPLSTRQGIDWEFTIGHPLLIYLYPSTAPADLYLLDPQNGEIQQLSDAPGAVLDYSLSPTGTSIYYNVSQGDGGSDIYRLDRLSGEAQLLLECRDALCRYPQISPSGDYLAYERTALSTPGQLNMPRVWLLPLAQSKNDAVQVGEPFLAAPADHKTQQPQWSPTGLLNYYDYDRSEFVVQDVQGREVAAFPSQTGIPGTWHPKGEYYVIPEIFTSEIADSDTLTDLEDIPTSRLLRYSLDGSMHDLTEVENVEDSSPAYTPDGEMLAFGRKYLDITHWTPGRQIWQMDSDGSEAVAISQDPYYNHYDLVWSPDGSRLAYVRFNKNSLIDPPELWLMGANGSAATRLVTGGYSPQWIP